MTSQQASVAIPVSAGWTPTPEQVRARDLFLTRTNIKLVGCAGSAKTSTLELLARGTHRRGYYLAFNASIRDEAKRRMPRNVHPMTTHGLAVRSTPHAYRNTPDKLFGAPNANTVALALDLRGFTVGNRPVTPRQQAACVLSTIAAFCNSGDDDVAGRHVRLTGPLARLDPAGADEMADHIVRLAQRLWQRMVVPNDPIPLGHNGYLKLWSLRREKLDVEYVLLDEAQDSNECVIRVLAAQDCQLICVGDPAQQIYSFRGAVDAMERLPADHTTYLSQSFRFGPQLAGLANIALALLGREVPILGSETIETRLGMGTTPAAILCRTNSGVIGEVVRTLEEGQIPHVVKGTAEIERLLEGVRNLRQGIPSDCPELFGYRNWQEVELAVEEGTEPDLKILVELVQKYGEGQLLAMLARTARDELDSTIVISTAHKAKGREWETVLLCEDFTAPERMTKEGVELLVDEVKLLYVAMTRAKTGLDLPHEVRLFLNRRKAEADAWWKAGRPEASPKAPALR
jgi:hypothetical protein